MLRRFALIFALLTGCSFAQQQIILPTVCNQSTFLQMTTATTTQLVALAAGASIRVCSYAIQGSTTSTATTLKFEYGTSASCAAGATALTPTWNMPASSTALPSSQGHGVGQLFQTPAGDALCAVSSAAGTVNIFITYAQF